jgi:hypothetical protein
MQLCSSALLTAALTTALILTNIFYRRTDRIFAHLFFGGVITALFAALCQYGYEMVNWGFLLLVPVSLLLMWLSTYLYLPTSASNVIAIPAQDFGNCTSCGQAAPPPCGMAAC